MSGAYTRGVLFVHSAPRALCPHIEWAAAEVLGARVHLDWTDQPAAPGMMRAETSWVTPASRFADDLDIDSLGLLTIATQVEERLGVTLDDSLIPNLPTVGALIDLVATQRA